jgi:hypothetical protein
MGKREPQIILKTDERTASNSGLRGNLQLNQAVGMKNRAFLEGDKLEVAVKARDGRPNCAMLFSGD